MLVGDARRCSTGKCQLKACIKEPSGWSMGTEIGLGEIMSPVDEATELYACPSCICVCCGIRVLGTHGLQEAGWTWHAGAPLVSGQWGPRFWSEQHRRSSWSAQGVNTHAWRVPPWFSLMTSLSVRIPKRSQGPKQEKLYLAKTWGLS